MNPERGNSECWLLLETPRFPVAVRQPSWPFQYALLYHDSVVSKAPNFQALMRRASILSCHSHPFKPTVRVPRCRSIAVCFGFCLPDFCLTDAVKTQRRVAPDMLQEMPRHSPYHSVPPTPEPTDGLCDLLLLPPDLFFCLTTCVAARIDLHGVRVVSAVAGLALLRGTPRLLAWNLLALIVEHLAAVDHFSLGLRVEAHGSIHLAGHQAPGFAELVDGADGVDRLMKRPSSVEVLLHCWEQVLSFACCFFGTCGVIGPDPGMLESLVRRDARPWIDCQTPPDKVSCCFRHVAPVFDRGERIVGGKDGLHFFEVAVAVEGSVAA